MKSKIRRATSSSVSALLLLASAVLAHTQLELIVIEKPFNARGLSGTVVDANGAQIPGAVVEECDAPFTPIEAKNGQGAPTGEILHGDCTRAPNRVISSTVTNLKGRFTLQSVKNGRIHFLHVSAPGFDPVQITVRIRLFAQAGVRIQLRIAT
ncbi:MAG TPA: carboxypeptidase-like regulatory domain-containing protein [Terracidiphilus sp.]|nr:carboxypeptidase-like regulatory domain-containing protein [Terracidiphilus sp.]